MEFNQIEVQLIEDVVQAANQAVKELDDLQMLSVGGGCATVDFA